jgi:hypothetical protein
MCYPRTQQSVIHAECEHEASRADMSDIQQTGQCDKHHLNTHMHSIYCTMSKSKNTELKEACLKGSTSSEASELRTAERA